MREATILEKIYRNRRDARSSLKEMVEDLVQVKAAVVTVSEGQRNWAKILLEGEEEDVAAAYLESYFGTITDLESVAPGEVRRGKVVDLGTVGYGIYADIGVIDSAGQPVDVLLPAFSLKKHLGVRGTMSIRRLSKAVGLMENFPLDVRVFSVDGGRSELEGRLTNSQARRLGRGGNRFYACGETRRKIKDAISRTGNSDSVIRIRRLGLLECEVQCSKEADPHEIVRQIGPRINADIAVPRGL